jgi:hypothetical protein
MLFLLYITEDGGDYECEELIGVYTTADLAKEAAKIHSGRDILWMDGRPRLDVSLFWEEVYSIKTIEPDAIKGVA